MRYLLSGYFVVEGLVRVFGRLFGKVDLWYNNLNACADMLI